MKYSRHRVHIALLEQLGQIAVGGGIQFLRRSREFAPFKYADDQAGGTLAGSVGSLDTDIHKRIGSRG